MMLNRQEYNLIIKNNKNQNYFPVKHSDITLKKKRKKEKQKRNYKNFITPESTNTTLT